MEVLQKEVKLSMKAAFSKGTSKNLKIQWRSYLLFCQFHGLKAIPATVETLCVYAQFLIRSFSSVESVKNYISGIKTMHLMLDVKFPSENLVQLNLLYKGMARKNPHLPHKALPVTPQILQDMFRFLNTRTSVDATFWCLFLFMFFLMSRKSNMVPVSYADFDPQKQLLRQDVKLCAGAIVVFIKWSKTNQFGSRLLKIPLTAIQGSVLCPVAAYTNMIKLTPALETAPAFCLNGPGHDSVVRPLLYSQLEKKLAALIAKTGRDPKLFSSHSFRRGGCSFAFKSGVPTSLIQHHGDWLSECYKNYLAFDFYEKLSVSESMAKRIIRECGTA